VTFKVGITDYVDPPFEIEASALGEGYELVHLDMENTGLEGNIERLRTLDALLVWHAHIDRALIDHLDTCKIVVRYGVGFDNIDVGYLTEKGIQFCNTPDYGTEEVADSAVAIILSLSRGIGAYDYDCRSYRDTWQENTIPGIRRLSNCTVGIIGLGRIGMSVLLRMKAFGCSVVGYDPYLPAGHEKAIGYRRVDGVNDLLEVADTISLHCPLNRETAGLVDRRFLGAMKEDAILVNTARGGLVANLDHIYEALQSRPLFRVGLDVLPEEPPGRSALIDDWREHAPWLRHRLIITPHTAYFSEEAWHDMRFKAAETARLFLSGQRLRNQITSN
jgi:D-3-phosphoglycerate dehydrogenase